MTCVTVLQCHHRSDIDPGPLSDLYDTLGAAGADQAICTMLEDLAQRLNIIHVTRISSGFDDLTDRAERMAVIAADIGLTEVATAAHHLSDSARQRDGIAVEATLARLERGFDMAIGQIWSMRKG
ncbi:hypothetical protein [Loktanella sp. SALINAS62]|uniref:hypothetical protein n=1 Tax=Loktanella sp. SALINAS62 TaxID=2706124 RepID=UPI001B8D5DFF|nr:hypothetical protein [Loktanella sp. SALINAS62]MBS1301040.1 hypothetical protein [Loktanella sp. SALINAS62]